MAKKQKPMFKNAMKEKLMEKTTPKAKKSKY